MGQEYKEILRIQKENSQDGVASFEKIVTYLLNSRDILYDAKFREDTLNKIQLALRDPSCIRFHDTLLLLWEKIERIEQEIIEHIPQNTEVLGKGGFGCVVKPALPNRKNGAWRTYPNNVSKVYFESNNATKGLQNAKRMYNSLKNEGHKMMKQPLTYKGSNLPSRTRRMCNIQENNIVTSTRMPHLGVSVADSLRQYTRFRKIPVHILFGQFVKLFQQLTTIVDQGYVHGDIRESNVMVNPKTGVFTLIDFDWFMPKHEFFEDYKQNLGFYNNPPESLLYESVLNHLRGEPLHYTIPTQKVNAYVTDNNRLRNISKFTSNALNEANAETIRKFANIRTIQEYFDAIFPSFDSYGMGYTLLIFCEYVYPYKTPMGDKFRDQGVRYTAEEVAVVELYVQQLYETVLFPTTDLRMEKRLNAHTAYTNMKRVHEEFETAMRNLVSNNLERFAKRTEIVENYKPKGTRKRRG